MNHHVNRRCDDLIQILLTIEEDVFFDRKRKEVMLSPHEASVRAEGEERHTRCKRLSDSSVTVRNIELLYIIITTAGGREAPVQGVVNCREYHLYCADTEGRLFTKA